MPQINPPLELRSNRRQPRLLFVSPSAYSLGGLSTWLDYLAPGLAARGWDVTVGVVDAPRFHRADAFLADHPFPQAIAIRCTSGTPAGRRRAVRRALHRVQPDLVVTINVPDAAVAASEAAESVNRPRVVMTCHGIEPELFADMRRFHAVLDAVVCTNRLAWRLAERAGGIPAARVHYAPYGVPTVAVAPRRTDDRLRIAFVGRLEESQKRVADLPRIAHELQASGTPFELLVAGDGPDRASLEAGLAPFVADGRARFLGRLNEAQLQAEVYSATDALLITSSWETGPIVAWEAMAHGLAVVSSRYLGYGLEGALVHGQNALLFPIGDSQAAADGLTRLWHDGLLRRRLTEGGQQLIAKRYGIPASIRHWHEVLEAALASPPLPRFETPALPKIRSRLDRWLGGNLAEAVRGLAGRGFAPRSPADEWPHAWSDPRPHAAEFAQLAERLDNEARSMPQQSPHYDSPTVAMH